MSRCKIFLNKAINIFLSVVKINSKCYLLFLEINMHTILIVTKMGS